jgi:hypothetical protein
MALVVGGEVMGQDDPYEGCVKLSLAKYEELLRHAGAGKFVIEKLYDFEKYGSFLAKSEVSEWLSKVNSYLEGRIE